VAKHSNGQACGGANQCTSGFCADGVCCNAACSGGGCDRCDLATNLGTCVNAPSGNSGSPSCTPYVCSGASASCPTSCTVDTNCVTGDYCDTGACVPKHLQGTASSARNQFQ